MGTMGLFPIFLIPHLYCHWCPHSVSLSDEAWIPGNLDEGAETQAKRFVGRRTTMWVLDLDKQIHIKTQQKSHFWGLRS